jgi:anti-sigma regulatory factor (Ser/Thr protein kinase)
MTVQPPSNRPSPTPGGKLSERSEKLQVAAETEKVAVARRFVRRVLADCDADDLVADLELVMSELVTNAIEHGDGHMVDMAVACDGHDVQVSVTSHSGAGSVEPSDRWQVAEASSITGRGLGIVRALADTIEVWHRSGQLQIVVQRALPAA